MSELPPNVDVPHLDYLLKFVREEMDYLEKNYKGLFWAETKGVKLRKVQDILLWLRREKQMTGVGGKRLSVSESDAP